MQEGISAFSVGSDTFEVHAGRVIMVPADLPHKFRNSSDRQLKQIDIHVNQQFITEWLEEQAGVTSCNQMAPEDLAC